MSSSEDVSTYFDQTLIGYENAIKNGYPQYGYLSLVIWICFLAINVTFLLIGCVRDGDVVCLAGLYGVYEMIWEFVRVDPHWTRRKIIIIQFFLKKFYHNSEFTSREQRKDGKIFSTENPHEEWMFWSHYGVKCMVISVFLNLK
jgi:hypothetical protein